MAKEEERQPEGGPLRARVEGCFSRSRGSGLSRCHDGLCGPLQLSRKIDVYH